MVEILSSVKTQSVKEIKKRMRLKKRNRLLIKLAIILIIVIVLAFLINNYVMTNKYSFVDKDSGILFVSKDFYVNDVFTVLSNDSNYMIIFNIKLKDMNKIGQLTDQIVFLQSVFAAKNRSNILVINVMDDQRRTINCQSNLGDLYTNNELTKDECDALLDTTITSFIIDFPDVSLEESIVYSSVGEKYIYIKSNSQENLDNSVLLVLSMMFDDLQSVKNAISNIRNKVDSNAS